MPPLPSASAALPASIGGNASNFPFTLVSYGPDGALSVTGAKLHPDTSVCVVLDPRHADLVMNTDRDLLTPYLQHRTFSNLLVVLLLPSTTSAPEYVVNIEVSIQSLAVASDENFPRKETACEGGAAACLRLVRIDDWFERGAARVVRAFEENADARIYGDAEAMGAFFESPKALAYAGEPSSEAEAGEQQHDGVSVISPSRFEASIYSLRAWCHWAVGIGFEEGEIVEAVEEVVRPTLKTSKAVAASDVLHLLDRSQRMPNVSCVGTEERGRTPQFFSWKKLKVSAGGGISASNSTTATSITSLQDELGDWSGPESVWLTEEKAMSLLRPDAYPILILTGDDVDSAKSASSLYHLLGSWFEYYRTRTTGVFVVLDHDDSVETVEDKHKDDDEHPFRGFGPEEKAPWWILVLAQALEQLDVKLFLAPSELQDAMAFFQNGALHADEQVARAVLRQLAPFPRISWLVFAESPLCCATGFADYELLGSSLTISPDGSGSNIPKRKWNAARNRWSTLCMSDQSFQPMTERVVVGKAGRKKRTIVNAGRFVVKLLKALLRMKETTEQAGDGDEKEAEARGNLEDLVCEYEQYLAVNDDRDQWVAVP